MTSPATPAEILSACSAYGAKRRIAIWLACHLLPTDVSPGRIESEMHAEAWEIAEVKYRLDRRRARGLIAAPAEVWREIVGAAG